MIILGVNPLFEGRNDVRSKNYERGENDMDSIFFRKDYQDHTADRVKNHTEIRSGMGFAFFSAIFLTLSVFLPFFGTSPKMLDAEYPAEWAMLFTYSVFQAFAVMAAGILAFALNSYRKHGLAAICGGVILLLWLIHFVSRTLDTFFKLTDISFEFSTGYWGRTDIYRYVRLIGYWVLPVAAGLVVYSSLALWKKNRKQKNVEEQET